MIRRKNLNHYTLHEDKKSWTYEGPLYHLEMSSHDLKSFAHKLFFGWLGMVIAFIVAGLIPGRQNSTLVVALPYVLLILPLALTPLKLRHLARGDTTLTLDRHHYRVQAPKFWATFGFICSVATLLGYLWMQLIQQWRLSYAAQACIGVYAILAFESLRLWNKLKITTSEGTYQGNLNED